MLQAEIVSNRILEVLQGRGRQSVYVRYTKKIGEVVLDFANDVSYMLIDYFYTESRGRNQKDTIRLMSRLKKGINNSDLNKILEIVLNEFLNEIKKDKVRTVADTFGRLTGKFVINKVALDDLVAIFANKFIGKVVVGFLFSAIFSIGGSTSRAIYSSEKLKDYNRNVYEKLKNAGDLDLFYFLVDSYATPFLDAMYLKQENPAVWGEILSRVAKVVTDK